MSDRKVINIDSVLHQRLKDYCDRESYKMSGITDRIVEEWLDRIEAVDKSVDKVKI